MHYDAFSWVIADAPRQTQRTPCRIRVYRPRRLGLDQDEFLRSGGYDEVDLQSALVAEEVKLTAAPQIRLLLDDFGGCRKVDSYYKTPSYLN
jgi:hypothetical protein